MTVLDQPKNRRSKDSLLLLALISLADIEDGAAYWQRLATQPLKYLPLARASRDGLPPEAVATTSVPAYDVPKMQYVQRLGDPIDDAAIRYAALGVIGKSQDESKRNTASMLSAGIELEEWEQNQYATIKRLHLAAAMVGIGGKQQLTADQLSRSEDVIPQSMDEVQTLGDLIAFQFGKLDNFSGQIADRAPSANTDAAIQSRVKLYGASAYPTFGRGRRYAALAAQMTQERNVLTIAEHCLSLPGDDVEDCPTQTDRGWVDIGSLVPIGERKCRMNCLCRLEYRRGDAQ